MKRALLFLLILPLLILALPIHADDTPEAAVTGFYSAYAAGDVRKAFAFWETLAAERVAQRAERYLRTRCLTVHRVTYDAAVIDGNKATVDAEALVTVASMAPGARPRIETRFMTFHLERHDRWQLVRWADREEALADRVAGLKSVVERKAVLADAGKLRTPRLADELGRRAVRATNRNDHADAAGLLDAARDVALDTGDDATLSKVLGVESILIRIAQSDPARGIEVATSALEVAERSGDPDAIASALARLGRAQFSIRTAVFRPPFERVLALAEFVDDGIVLANAASQLVFAASEAHDYSGQLRYAAMALRFAEMSGEDDMLYNGHYAVAEAYGNLEHDDLATRHFEKAIEVAERAGLAENVIRSQHQLAAYYLRLGREHEARELIERALPAANRQTRVHLLTLRSQTSAARGDLAAAEKDLIEAGGLCLPNEPERVAVASVMVDLRMQQGRPVEALAIANESVRIAKDFSPREQAYTATRSIRALRKLKRFDEARARLSDALRLVEHDLATTAVDETHLSTFYASRAGMAAEAVALAVESGNPEEALRAAERVKARGLRAFIERSKSRSARLLTGEERERENALNARIVALNRQILRSGGDGARARLQAEIERSRLDLEDLRGRVASRARSVRLPAAIEDPRQFARGSAVVEYVSTGGELFVIGVSPGQGSTRRIIATGLPITPRELSKKIERLLEMLESRDLRYPQASREMFDLLLGPVRALLGSGQTLCVIPDAELWQVPFQALQAPDGRYLAEITPLFYAPSLALADLALSRNTPSPAAGAPTLLAFANPELHARSVARYRSAFSGADVGSLPDAEEEVREVARIYGRSHSRVYVGVNATETNLKDESGRVGVLHIATHGAVDAVSPLASAMLLAPGAVSEDGVLEAREILDLAVGSDLAVLSACSTGGGKTRSAEGILGLSWAFLAGGCPTTVVSQWKATSSVTSKMMIEFHRHLRAGDSAAKALRKAQLRTRRDPRYRHPYYWAPFVVIGAQ